MERAEYVRVVNSNYLRIRHEKKPEDGSYQYCIMLRGAIKGLLSLSIRNMDGVFFSYYDVTSYQNIKELMEGRTLDRDFVISLFEALKSQIKELKRFLLDYRNVCLEPEMIFRDIETGDFAFLFIPYNEEQGSFARLSDYLLEKIDYKDESLVETVYDIYEKYENSGDLYLESSVFADICAMRQKDEKKECPPLRTEVSLESYREAESPAPPLPEKKKNRQGGLFKRNRESRERYRERILMEMAGVPVEEEEVNHAYAELPRKFTEDYYGKTVYLEDYVASERNHFLKDAEGRRYPVIGPELTIGKKKDDCRLVFEDPTISRIHARIVKENDKYYIEDMNSTNGTFKNGLRMNPYERRELDSGDEIRLGRVCMVYS